MDAEWRCSADCPDPRWERQEAGWWTHPVHGGLSFENGRWHHWRLNFSDPVIIPADRGGPWRTLEEAFAALESET